MERLCFEFEIVEGKEEEYDRMHREIWPELAAAIIDAGYRDYALFRRGTRVICNCKCDPDVATVRAKMEELYSDLTARWTEAMDPLIARFTDDDGELFEFPVCWVLDETGS